MLCINKCLLGIGGFWLFYKNFISYVCGKNFLYRCMFKSKKMDVFEYGKSVFIRVVFCKYRDFYKVIYVMY